MKDYTGKINIGSLVIRNIKCDCEIKKRDAIRQRQRLGFGVVLTRQMSGTPLHPCLTVYYPKVGKIYDIGESLMEVLGAKR